MESSDDVTNELPASDPEQTKNDELRARVERLEQIADERSKETAPLRSVLEELRLEMRQNFTELRGEVGELRGEVGELRGEVGVLRGEVGEIRDEVGVLRGEVGVLRGEVGELRGEVGVLRGEVGELRGEVGELRGEVGEIRGGLAQTTQNVEAIGQDLATFRTEMRRTIADSTRNITQVIQSGFTQVNFEMALMSTRVSDLEARVTKIEESRPQTPT
jgi:chromosome segregation ATPase